VAFVVLGLIQYPVAASELTIWHANRWRYNPGMSDVALAITAAVASIAVGVLGVILSLYTDLTARHRKKIIAAFLLIPAIGIAATEWRASQAGEEITRLNNQILFEVKGSPDSYVDISPYFHGKENYENGVAIFSVYNDSGYPMIDTSVGIVGSTNFGDQNLLDYHRRIGDVLYERGGQLPRLTVKFSKEWDNRIDFAISSRSVYLWQYLYVTWNGKRWVSDYSLRKKVGKDGKEVYIKKLREDFPFIKKGMWLTERENERVDAEAAKDGE
jgi:hypothetical protein